MLTPMKVAIARPLVTGLSNRSAYIPPLIAIGLLALTPARNLNIRSAPQLGATAHPNVKSVKRKKVEIMMNFLPYASESGPNSKGPTMYPTK